MPREPNGPSTLVMKELGHIPETQVRRHLMLLGMRFHPVGLKRTYQGHGGQLVRSFSLPCFAEHGPDAVDIVGAPPEGKDPHAYDTWNPNPELKNTWGERKHNHPSMLESSLYGSSAAGNEGQVSNRPVKRDYSKGHQLDERYEDDKLRMAANERRMLSFVGFAVALGAVVAAGRAAA